MEDRKESHSPRAIAACIALGCLIGGIVGAVIFFFKLIGEHLEEISHHIYEAASSDPLMTVLVILGLTILAVAMYLLHRFAPEIKGGGIPRSTGIMRGVLSFRRIRTLVGTVIGSWISFFSGLLLGSEGPSVLIGTSIGSLFQPVTKKDIWSRYMPTAGAGAGFAVATGSPLTAVLFIIEEVHKRLTARLVLITSASVLAAYSVNRLLCGAFGISHLLFPIDRLPEISFSQIGYVLLLGVIVAAFVWIFDVLVVGFRTLMKKAGKRIPDLVKLLFVFVVTGVVGIIRPSAIYGGRGLLLGILDGSSVFGLVAILLCWRLIMMILTSNSGATGGSFVPTLCIGGLIGGVSAELMISIGMPAELYGVFVLIAMCAFLGGTMRAPLTAIVFFVEATCQSENLFFAVLAVFVVYFITNALGRHSFNDVVLEEMIGAQGKLA